MARIKSGPSMFVDYKLSYLFSIFFCKKMKAQNVIFFVIKKSQTGVGRGVRIRISLSTEFFQFSTFDFQHFNYSCNSNLEHPQTLKTSLQEDFELKQFTH